MSSRSQESSQLYEMSNGMTMCEAVVTAVASEEGVDETELERPLYDAVDPNALNQVFRGSDGWITFEYYGYVITADADRNVELLPLEDEDDSPQL
jgi:hypothetical protein